jgi:prepilin-type N-terminal cleavage/methylation domain-containing protein
MPKFKINSKIRQLGSGLSLKISDFLCNRNKKGFTLIELLIVVAILAILATVVFVALNPVARFEDARNSRRWSDVNAILSAIKLSQVDKRGYIAAITSMTNGAYYQIGTGASGCLIPCYNPAVNLESTCVDLSELVDDGYLPSVPIDPSATGANASYTHYYLSKSETGSMTAGGCDEEIGSADAIPVISVSR